MWMCYNQQKSGCGLFQRTYYSVSSTNNFMGEKGNGNYASRLKENASVVTLGLFPFMSTPWDGVDAGISHCTWQRVIHKIIISL